MGEIDAESYRQLVRKLGDELPAHPTDQQLNTLSAKKSSLLKKIQAYKQDIAQFMGSRISHPDHPDRRKVVNAEPEHTELGLPSSYLSGSLSSAGLSSMPQLELVLRRAVCDDAIQSLRGLLGVKAATLKFKNANVRGEIKTTRAEARLKEHNKKIAAVQWRYNNSRAALIRLGIDDTELEIYQQVTPNDLKYLKTYMDTESRKPGEGYREVPWLWKTSVTGKSEDWQVEGERSNLHFC